MSEVTNYLKLKFIQLASTRWYSDFNENLSRLDLLGKHLRIQQGVGESTGFRASLVDGTLVEYVRAVPNGQGVDIYIGRPQSSDRVIIQAPSDGVGSRTSVESLSLAPTVATAGSWIAIPGQIGALGAGTWDIDAMATVRATIETAATAHPQIQVWLGLFATGGVTPVATARMTADMVTAVDALRDHYQSLSLKAINLAGSTSYTLKVAFFIINNSFVSGDGTKVTLEVPTSASTKNFGLAVRTA